MGKEIYGFQVGLTFSCYLETLLPAPEIFIHVFQPGKRLLTCSCFLAKPLAARPGLLLTLSLCLLSYERLRIMNVCYPIKPYKCAMTPFTKRSRACAIIFGNCQGECFLQNRDIMNWLSNFKF